MTTVTKDNFKTEVLEQSGPVLIDFYANWCGPCKMLSPVVEALEKEMPEIKVCKVDIDQQGELAQEFRVMSIPTLVVMKDGKPVQQSVGVVSKDKIVEMLK